MTYLHLYDRIDWWHTHSHSFPNAAGVYVLPPEAESLYKQWEILPFHTDGLLSGIIADWLEENAQLLHALQPNADLLRLHIGWWRKQFADPERNRSHQ